MLKEIKALIGPSKLVHFNGYSFMSLKRERDREREACGHKNSTLKQINEKERMESNKVNKDSL